MAAASVPAAPSAIAYGEARGRWVLAATVLGSSMAFLDATVINIALPAIGADLGAGVAGLTWTVNAYTLTLAAFVLVGGTLGDRLGRRRVFLVGTAWFGLASLVCAIAPTEGTLIAARALQGVGAALLTPGALSILESSFREDDRSRAIGAWSGLAGISGAVGPFVGGWLVGVGSWRWIFVINVPVALAVLAIASRHVPESRALAASGRVDTVGAALAVVGLGALTFGLSVWPEQGAGSPGVLLGVGLGVVALACFVLWERSSPNPMLPLDVFRSTRFSVTNLATFVTYAALGGIFFWIVVTLQVVSGWEPLAAGLSLLPITVLMLLFSPSAGTLGDRIGPRIPMTVGPILGAVGVGSLAWSDMDAPSPLAIFAATTLLALGLTITVTPLTSTVLGAVPEEQAGLASGVNNAVARTGSLLLVAVLPALTGLGVGGFDDAAAVDRAFSVAMGICAALLALGAVLAAVFLRAPMPEEAEVEHAECVPRHCAVGGPPAAVSHT